MNPQYSPLENDVLFRIGPAEVARPVVTTWAIIIVLGLASWLGTRKMSARPGRWQTVLEGVVGLLGDQIREIVRRAPAPFLPLIGTLFLFIAAANLSALLPGVTPPTASLETPAALALIVFFSVHAYGVQARGVGRYLRSYLEPNPLMLPLNILSEITRTFSLMVRLFGNVMSHELIIGIVIALAGLLVPIPFMALTILIGLIQAYIFSVLATVFVGAAVGAVEKG
jgi:F-type H+-transporting ATPase subunit a